MPARWYLDNFSFLYESDLLPLKRGRQKRSCSPVVCWLWRLRLFTSFVFSMSSLTRWTQSKHTNNLQTRKQKKTFGRAFTTLRLTLNVFIHHSCCAKVDRYKWCENICATAKLDLKDAPERRLSCAWRAHAEQKAKMMHWNYNRLIRKSRPTIVVRPLLLDPQTSLENFSRARKKKQRRIRRAAITAGEQADCPFRNVWFQAEIFFSPFQARQLITHTAIIATESSCWAQEEAVERVNVATYRSLHAKEENFSMFFWLRRAK